MPMHIRRRRDFLKAMTGAAAIGLTVGSPHVARAQQKVTCRIGHSEAIGSPLTDAFEKWAKLLNEKSGGRIEAQHFPASQLGSYTQNIEQNRLGTIQVTTGGADTGEGGWAGIPASRGCCGCNFLGGVRWVGGLLVVCRCRVTAPG